MTQSAIVEKIYGDGFAQVSVERISACGKSCASCSGGCSEKHVISVRAANGAGAKPGDRVVIESSTKGVLGAALLVYLVPIAFFFAAYMLTMLAEMPEAACILISLGAFFAGAVCVYLVNRLVRRDRELEYTIVSVVNDICSGM